MSHDDDICCDVCGNQATNFARDTYETAPILSNGQWVGTHRVGELKSGCDLHPVYGTDYLLSDEEVNRLTMAVTIGKAIDYAEFLLESEKNYNSHEWTGHKTGGNDGGSNPPEWVRFCSRCGIEDLGDPTEFDTLKYPHCDDVGIEETLSLLEVYRP